MENTQVRNENFQISTDQKEVSREILQCYKLKTNENTTPKCVECSNAVFRGKFIMLKCLH